MQDAYAELHTYIIGDYQVDLPKRSNLGSM